MKRVSIALTIFVSLYVFIIIIGEFFPFEFSTLNWKVHFYTITLFALPIGISAKIFITRHNKNKNYVKNIVVSLLLGFLAFIIAGFLFLGNMMCGYTTKAILFEKKSDNSIKIIQRYLGCGAWDSDMPKYEYVEIDPITPFMNYVSKTDTAKLDKSVWLRIYP
ncbi:MAG: hypothetical protein ACXVED_03420 [Bacteroidia bacterium]